MDELMPKIQAH
jgi:hypothetical protein